MLNKPLNNKLREMFNQYGHKVNQITEADIENASNYLNVDVPAIKAVIEVESSGKGFLKSGRPKILFEAHHFSRLTNGKYNSAFPKLSSNKWNRELYKGGELEYTRLLQAYSLDEKAALMSTSWGLFQIMGFNYIEASINNKSNNIYEFVYSMFHNEANHLIAFCEFVKSNRLDRWLKERRWIDFARRYNGPSYATNNYDTKLATSYAKHLRQIGKKQISEAGNEKSDDALWSDLMIRNEQ